MMNKGTEKFTSRLGQATAFPITPLYEGDRLQELRDELNRDLQLHKAHVVMLFEQDILTLEVAKAILWELLDLEHQGISAFSVDPSLGLYLSTEQYLVNRLGSDVAGRIILDGREMIWIPRTTVCTLEIGSTKSF